MTAGTGRAFLLETYGCQMNTSESIALIQRLTASGWRPAESCEEADLVILNTCAVRQTAENRIWGRLGFYGKQKDTRGFEIAVMGCMSERIKEDMLKRAPFVDYVVGVSGRNAFLDYLCSDEKGEKAGFIEDTADQFRFDGVYGDATNFRALVPIMHGCNNFCTYCIVPYVRGREVSRKPEDIFSECSTLYAGSVLELNLLGQNVNSYRQEIKGRELLFPDLLEEIIAETPFPWIRFISSHPKDFSHRLIGVIRDNPSVCRHIHLPVQHGSDTILERMNRKYNTGYYRDLVDEIRRNIPGIALSTDLMIGFPGEREKDFRDTIKLVEEVRFDDAFTYYYNPREGTAAFNFSDQVPLEVKKERLNELIRVQRRLTRESRQAKIGKEARVLVEAVSKKRSDQVLGRTSENEMIICAGNCDMIGTLGRAIVTGISGTTLQGEWLA